MAMNYIPIPIQKIIYRYIHRDALTRGFKEILPIYATTSPFSMDRIRFNEIGTGIEECTRFKSDMCRMCYARNKNGERSLHVWTRCYSILCGLEDFTILNGDIWERIIIHENDISPPLYKLRKLPIKARIDVTKRCLYSQLFHMYDWILDANGGGGGIFGFDNYVPLYEQENE